MTGSQGVWQNKNTDEMVRRNEIYFKSFFWVLYLLPHTVNRYTAKQAPVPNSSCEKNFELLSLALGLRNMHIPSRACGRDFQVPESGLDVFLDYSMGSNHEDIALKLVSKLA